MIEPQLAEALADRYVVLRELGGGGSATVYLAEDLKHQRQVAVKVLRPEFAASLAAERFLREISTVARLQHPHILPLLDSGRAAGFLYFVMPYVDGETLRARLRREGRLPVPDVIRILADVTDAVAHAHARGVVHRDLKPENILLSGRHAVVTDFGVARAASVAAESERQLTVGVALGTPAYMSPEQAVASPDVDHRADVYALGVLAYELLAGRPPFSGATPQDVLTMHVVVAPEPVTSHRADVPADLARVVMRCLEKRPGERWQTAGELLQQLEPLATPSGGVTPANLAPVRPPRRAAVLGVAGAVVLLLAATLLRRTGAGDPAAMARPAQITFRGDVIDAVPSPDGQFLAFTVQDTLVQRLMVQEARGGTAIEVAVADKILASEWSADGAEIRFLGLGTFRRRLYTVPRLGGTPRVASPYYGGMSADGAWVAWVPGGTRRLELRGPSPTDSQTVPIPYEFTWGLIPQWTRDGRRMAVPLLGQTGDSRSAVAVARPGGRIQIVADDQRMIYGVTWSRDGDQLYVLREDGATFTAYRMTLDENDRLRGAPVEVASGLVPYWPEGLTGSRLAVSNEGDRFTYIRDNRRSNIGLLAVGADPGVDFRALTTGTADHPAARLSHDGRKAAFIRLAAGVHSVHVLDLVSGGEEELARFENSFSLAWSPDDQALIVAATEAGGQIAFHVLPLDGTARKHYLSGAAGPEMDWFAADSVVYQRNGNQRLGILDLATGRDSLLSQTDGSGWVFRPRVTPDRRTVVYDWYRGEGRFELWSASLADTGARMLAATAAYPLRFSTDGRRLWSVEYVSVDLQGRLMEVTMSTGQIRVLDTVPSGLLVLDMDTAGRTQLVTRLERQTDAWSVALPLATGRPAPGQPRARAQPPGPSTSP